MENTLEKVLKLLTTCNKKDVERDTGIPADRIYKWLKGKGNPKAADMEILVKHFKIGINSESNDIITKENKPLSNNKNLSTQGIELKDIAQINSKLSYDENSTFPLNKERPTTNTENKGVPYYDVDFMGGFDLVFDSQQVQPSFYIDFLPFNDCDCWINVTGKSMGPLIAHGDIVGLKKVPDWQRFLLEGEIYAIITDNGFRTIKMIGAGPDREHYTLIPYNKSEEYRPQVIPKEVITHIFRVKGNIKKFF